MTIRYARLGLARSLWLAAALTVLAGCADAGAGYSGSSSPAAYGSPDPYHYRCTGNCQAGG